MSRLASDRRPPPPRTRAAHLHPALRMKVKCWTVGGSFARVRVGAGDRELKRRGWGCALPRCLSLRLAGRCATRCGTRALRHGLAVPGEASIGDLCLCGQLLLEPMLCGCREDADRVALALAPLGTGRELELADLLAGERGASEGVVLAAAEHVPGDHG